MKRLLSGMVPLLVLLIGVGCSTEPTDDLRNGVARLDASPSQLFLQLGETKAVEVAGLDEQGNPQSLDYQVTAVGSGITVKRDSTFRPNFENDSTLVVPGQAPSFRFLVTATAYTTTDFTVSAGGKDVKVAVQVVPRAVLQAQISNLTPALGEVVTITAPAGITFQPTTTVTLADTTAVQPFNVTVAADGKSITFLPPPNMASAQLVISDVVSDGAPDMPFSPVTEDRFTTPELRLLDATISDFAPPANQTVTVTVNNATFDPTASFAVGLTPAIVLDISGNVATILPTPGSVGLLTANGVLPDSLPGYFLPLTSPEPDTVTVGALTPLAGTDDPTTAPSLPVPAVGGTAILFDAPDFAAAIDRFYKLVVPADGDYTISLDWSAGSDIDMILCDDVACSNPDFTAATGDQPEVATYTLTAGTYYVIAEDFGEDAGGATITFKLTR
jgi:hypothetical protein